MQCLRGLMGYLIHNFLLGQSEPRARRRDLQWEYGMGAKSDRRVSHMGLACVRKVRPATARPPQP